MCIVISTQNGVNHKIYLLKLFLDIIGFPDIRIHGFTNNIVQIGVNLLKQEKLHGAFALQVCTQINMDVNSHNNYNF